MEAKLLGFIPQQRLWEARVECLRCGLPFTFKFTQADAGIQYQHGAVQVAQSYIERAAPSVCSTCSNQDDEQV